VKDGRITVTTDASSGGSYTADYAFKMEFEKDGSFSRTIEETNMTGDGIAPGRTILYEFSGTCNFRGGIDRDY
jgi:hypothetical protein